MVFFNLRTCISDYFCILDEVKQGGILSPKLFSVYVDDLSDKSPVQKFYDIGIHFYYVVAKLYT